MKGIEKIYREHHARRGRGFALLLEERGAFLEHHVGKGKKVLDVGCRDGELTATYAEGNLVTGADIDEEALKAAKLKLSLDTKHVDLNDDWPFADGQYDVVVACEFLEHVYFPERIVAGARRSLAPDAGRFVGTIPHAYSLQSRIKFLLGRKDGTPLEDPTHINHFTYREFKSLLSTHFSEITIVGWTPPRYAFLSQFFPYLFAHDLMFVATKPRSFT